MDGNIIGGWRIAKVSDIKRGPATGQTDPKADAGPFGPHEQDTHTAHTQAHRLASQLPELMAEAAQVSHTVAHGLHGRRKRGPGETFWQFRQYEVTDHAAMIDWRKSGSSDQYFVREREWEAAHTVWIGADLSASMNYLSGLANTTKRTRMAVLSLALAELLVRGGERVGMPGRLTPSPSRFIPQRLGESLFTAFEEDASPDREKEHDEEGGQYTNALESAIARRFHISSQTRFSPLSEIVLFSDFLEPHEEVTAFISALAARNMKGHLVQILDPSEETLPFRGRVVFEGMQGSEVVTENVDEIRPVFQQRLHAHRETLKEMCRHINWSFQVHHTDRPAEEALLALYGQIGGMEF